MPESLSSILVSIGADLGPLQRDLPLATRLAVDAMERAGERAGTGFSHGAGRGFLSVIHSLDEMRYAATLTGQALSFVSGIGIAAEYQMYQVRLESLVGSAELARDILGELQDYGARTQFNTAGLVQYATNLRAAGFAAEGLVGNIHTLADTVAARGLGTEAVGRLSNVLGQVRAGGVTGNDRIQFQSLGLNLGEVVNKSLGRTDLKNFTDAQAALRGMSGEEQARVIMHGLDKMFGGMAERLGTSTLTGIVQNIGDTARNAFLPSGQNVLPVAQFAGRGLLGAVQTAQGVNEMTGGVAGLALLTVGVIRFRGVIVGVTTSITQLTVAMQRMSGATTTATAATNGKAAADTRAGFRSGWAPELGPAARGLGWAVANGGAVAGIAGMIGGTAIGGQTGGLLSGAGTGALVGSQFGGPVGALFGAIAGAYPTLMEAQSRLREGDAKTTEDRLLGIVGNLTAFGSARNLYDQAFGSAQAKDQKRTADAAERTAAAVEGIKGTVIGGGDRTRSTLSRLEMEFMLNELLVG